MSQNSVAVANEAAKNPELLGSTNQDSASEQVKTIKEQEKQRKATAKFTADDRNSFVDRLDGSENGFAAQSGNDGYQNANENTSGDGQKAEATSVTEGQPNGALTQAERDEAGKDGSGSDTSSES